MLKYFPDRLVYKDKTVYQPLKISGWVKNLLLEYRVLRARLWDVKIARDPRERVMQG